MTATICYFLQTHRDPEQIYRLVRRLRAGSQGSIYVQHNPVDFPLDWEPLRDLPDTHPFVASGKQIRHNFSCQVQPYLEFVDFLEREGVHYDWLVNLTAQDYPVQPVADFEKYLSAATADGFLRYWDVQAKGTPWSRRRGKGRYWYKYRRLSDGAEPWLRALRGFTRVLPLHFYLACGPWFGVRARVPFRDDFRCYGGWAWFSLRRRAVQYLREFLAARPDVLEHYRHVMVAEESIVQTVLVNSRRFQLVDDDLRYIDYSHAVKGSPRTMTCADLPLLASGRYYFARKFDLGVDRAVLDRIDRELLGVDRVG